MLAVAVDRGLRRGQYQGDSEFGSRRGARNSGSGDWPIACNLVEKISSLPEGVWNPCRWYFRYRVSRGRRIVLRGASRSFSGVIPLGAR
jgi:hypothetical protein